MDINIGGSGKCLIVFFMVQWQNLDRNYVIASMNLPIKIYLNFVFNKQIVLLDWNILLLLEYNYYNCLVYSKYFPKIEKKNILARIEAISKIQSGWH
jgi:hypothetical protein